MINKKLRIAFIVITSIVTALIIGYIFSNSAKVPAQSTAQSGGVYVKVEQVVTEIIGEQKAKSFFEVFTEYVMRKTAHFVEFSALGISVNLLILSIFGTKIKPLGIALGGGLIVGVIDELIQKFTGRNCSVYDMLLDFSAILFITLIFLIIYLIVNKKKKKREEQAS